MAVSGSTNFELDVSDYIEEAFERCGQWTIEQATVSLTQGTGNYSLGASTIDVLNAVVRRSNTDYALERISRSDFINIPTKTTQGRPSQFFVDRQIDPTLKLWPVPENSTDTVVIDKLVRMDDADTFTNTMDIPFRFYPCLAAGLAYYLAIKRAPDRVQLLKAVYEEEFERAASEDRDRASFNIQPSMAYSRLL
jgi:hypothetical protein